MDAPLISRAEDAPALVKVLKVSFIRQYMTADGAVVTVTITLAEDRWGRRWTYLSNTIARCGRVTEGPPRSFCPVPWS